jgi:hypothetical protein
MFEIIKDYQLFGFFGGSVAAYFINMLVQHLRRPKILLGYSVSWHRAVEEGNQGLVVLYKGREIQRLHYFNILLVNIGNRALRDIPVTIKCTSPAEIVEHEVVAPLGANFVTNLSQPSTLYVTCDLLNIKERAEISITVLNGLNKSKHDAILVAARHEDMQFVEIIHPDAVLGIHYEIRS